MLENAQQDVAKILAKFMGKVQNGALERTAQNEVTAYFKQRQVRKKVYDLGCGIAITGVQLAFDVGYVGVKHWQTAWHPADPYNVGSFDPDAVPLGLANGSQIYLKRNRIIVRNGLGRNFGSWDILDPMKPLANTLFFVGMQRAKALGHIA